jgi:hypothetical protein
VPARGSSEKSRRDPAAKKKLKWRTTFGIITLEEQLLRAGRRGPELRPFCLDAQVRPGGYSRRLQRVLVDFGAEESFASASLRVREHYDIKVPASGVRACTLRHAKAIGVMAEVSAPRPSAPRLLTEMDGSMVPIVETRAGSPDRRKNKILRWEEARLCMARAEGSCTPLYGATLGQAEVAGWLWKETAQQAGLGPATRVHGVGDGAPWILARFQNHFGEQGRYLIDFYHASEYLAAAAKTAAKKGREKQWLRRQQGRLLNNQVPAVLRALDNHLEEPEATEAPVRTARQYLQERRAHLDYARARALGLSIGSGEIESGHRHVIQQRLKIAGAWWTANNMEKMLTLRTARSNQWWEPYWLLAKN